MNAEPVRYYVVRVGKDYAIWPLTIRAMAAKTNEDPTLADRMDRRPYDTREEAEKRRAELLGNPARRLPGALGNARDRVEHLNFDAPPGVKNPFTTNEDDR
jgi:hypothetical protein